jgi:hypothetical protein
MRQLSQDIKASLNPSEQKLLTGVSDPVIE